MNRLTHTSTGGMYELINKIYTTYGFQNYAKKFCASCVVCGKQNVQGKLKPRSGRIPNAQIPFHTVCMDFIELNKCENKKYRLVIIDLYSKLIEVISTVRSDAITVAKALVTHIAPRFGFLEIIYSDNGPHFRNDVIAKLSESFSIKMKYHCSYHPQSAGLVERANGTIKAKLRKAMEDTGKGWITCLPAVMLSLHIQPNDTGQSPFEILYGRPYRVPLINLKGDDTELTETIVDYMSRMLKNKETMSTVLSPTEPVPDQMTPVKPGDWVFTKMLKRKNWSSPRWEGPFQVLLATPTAVRIAERTTWLHLTHCKRAPIPTDK
ncbi:uncharacterized protein LOC121906607 [Thunnus maccoyii]|uniref:uncharacterized protein LOC121906607 n=1 Tax=Thunnus maccoyii TaxID=8240 RepID=UPI001C4BBF11|nr:uncharacterized protein LOC121906607 [Thunnus maccoyii]